MISLTIPYTSRIIQKSVVFPAVFNAVTPGKYNFNGGFGNYQAIMPILKGSLYFLQSVTIGGNIAVDSFLDSISVFPQLSLFRSTDKYLFFPQPFPVVNYVNAQEVNSWIFTDRDGDVLNGFLTGILDQTADLIGVSPVQLSFQFDFYEISDTAFVNNFRQGNADTFRKKLTPHAIETIFTVGR